MNNRFFIIALFFLVTVAYTQDEVDFKPSFLYDDGLGVMSPDTSYLINFRFRMQNRLGMYTKSAEDLRPDEFEARVRRLRLRMDGFLVDQRFSYYIQLSFSRGDQDWDNSRVPNVVRDAALFYFFQDNLYLCFGQTKLPGNRQRVISSGMQQFAERSVVNATMNIDRDFGLRLYHELNHKNLTFRYQAAITSGEGRNALNSDNGLSYTGRVEFLPFGKFKGNGDYFEGDLLREATPKLSLGSSISYNQKAIRTGGQIGALTETPSDIRTFITDMMFKYSGFSLYGEYMYRNSTVKEVVLQNEDSFGYIYNGFGTNVQASYLLKNNLEFAIRYALLNPSEAIREWNEGYNEIVLGVTKYFNTHRVKAQLNLMYLSEHYLFNQGKSRFGTLFQIEVGI